jgi:hypothetical protein
MCISHNPSFLAFTSSCNTTLSTIVKGYWQKTHHNFFDMEFSIAS